MKTKSIINLIALLFISSIALVAQTSKNTVILYNVVPLNVDLMPDGTIKRIYGKAYDRFKGYQLVRKDQHLANEEGTNEQFSEMDKDIIVSTDVSRLAFEEGMALLSGETIKLLEKIKNRLFQNPNRKIILTSYAIQEGSKVEEILLQNRLAACLSYLEILGVSKSRIILDTNTQTNEKQAIIAAEVIKSDLVEHE